MKKKSWIIIGSIGAALVISLAPTQAKARYYDSIGGAACQPYYPYSSVYSTNLYHEGFGIINTDSTQTKYVECPIERVNASSTTGLYWGGVWFVDQSATHSFYCTLESYDGLGNILGSVTAHSTASNVGTSSLLFYPGLPSDNNGNYSMYCAIPPGYSAIMSYNVLENN